VVLIDTHCHLAAGDFAADRAAVAAAARAAGVRAIVVPAVDLASLAAVRECCASIPGCAAAYGIHPLYVPQAAEGDLRQLREWLEQAVSAPRPVVALGEIGLDLHVADADVERQERFFVEQLRMARDFGLPVLLHVRRAVDRVLKYLRRVPVPGGIAHAFNGSRQQADEFIALGFRLGLRWHAELRACATHPATGGDAAVVVDRPSRPMRRTCRQPGSTEDATRPANCRGSPPCWPDCVTSMATNWRG
jgi:TatD DNase family protein